MTQDWFSPGEIKFDRSTVLWLIQNLTTLREGHWPPEDSMHLKSFTKGHSGKAPFVTPVEYAAEISERMEECGQDGLILEAIECWGKSEDSMSRYLRMPTWSVRRRFKSALAYVASGLDRRWHDTKKRKGKSYREFLKKE